MTSKGLPHVPPSMQMFGSATHLDIFSTWVNKGIMHTADSHLSRTLCCVSDLLLICSSAIMFTEIGYFGWRQEFSDSIEATAKEIDAHLASEFLQFLLKKTAITRIRNIYRFSENSIPKPKCCMTNRCKHEGEWLDYYGPVTRGGIVQGVFCLSPEGIWHWPWPTCDPAKSWKMLDLKLWNSFDTFSSYQAGKVWGYWTSRSHTKPRASFMGDLI